MVEIAEKLSALGCKIYLTTNGLLLKKKKEICKYLKKINISIHSLDKNKYNMITGTRVDVEKIIETIKEIKLMYPNLDITIDVTLLDGINTDTDVDDFIEISKELNVKIKFIELFLYSKEKFYNIKNVENKLIKYGFVKTNEYVRKIKYEKDGAQIYIAKCFCNLKKNKNAHGKYCNMYNDLYISPDGKIELCKLTKREINILDELKEKNEEKLIKKLNYAYEVLGNFCLVEEENIWR